MNFPGQMKILISNMMQGTRVIYNCLNFVYIYLVNMIKKRVLKVQLNKTYPFLFIPLEFSTCPQIQMDVMYRKPGFKQEF